MYYINFRKMTYPIKYWIWACISFPLKSQLTNWIDSLNFVDHRRTGGFVYEYPIFFCSNFKSSSEVGSDWILMLFGFVDHRRIGELVALSKKSLIKSFVDDPRVTCFQYSSDLSFGSRRYYSRIVDDQCRIFSILRNS